MWGWDFMGAGMWSTRSWFWVGGGSVWDIPPPIHTSFNRLNYLWMFAASTDTSVMKFAPSHQHFLPPPPPIVPQRGQHISKNTLSAFCTRMDIEVFFFKSNGTRHKSNTHIQCAPPPPLLPPCCRDDCDVKGAQREMMRHALLSSSDPPKDC